MSYLKDFQTLINQRDFNKMLHLWEEYCTSDTVDVEEVSQILQKIKISEFAKPFGKYVEMILPVWSLIKDEKHSYDVLKLIIDLETTQSPVLADTTMQMLTKTHGKHPQFQDRLRLIGLRSRENFQGAISNYDLLNHIAPAKFVYHTGGWGAGEIMEISPVREQLSVEFENVAGRKHVTFSNAFKTLLPLPDDHFLARRFSDADILEKDAREDAVEVIKLLLRDLGPKNAAEIKDELCELVIPEKDWAKWWQNARGKLKKDTMVESPNALKDPFYLRKVELKHEDQFLSDLKREKDSEKILLTCYNFARDHTNMLKNQDVRATLIKALSEVGSDSKATQAQKIQVALFFENFFGQKWEKSVSDFVQGLKNPESIIDAIEIVAFKKQMLTAIREHRADWGTLFLSLLFHIQQGALRDYILNELNSSEERKNLVHKLTELGKNPGENPDLFIWYFQKISSKDDTEWPFSDKQGQCLFFESFLILMSQLENSPTYRDMTKKMYTMISAKRYALVRSLLEGTSLEFVKEFLLLASKCHTFTDHDTKILRSLAEVVHPSLATKKANKDMREDSRVIWTTEEGYFRVQDKIKQIGTVEIVDNAREIEAARALGDLRENSEYKFALERRARLQGDLKTLSDQFGRARIITKNDVHPSEVGIGSVVSVKGSNGKSTNYVILGPWDADVEKNILSFQSKLAQSMLGRKAGDKFEFRDEEFEVIDVKSYL